LRRIRYYNLSNHNEIQNPELKNPPIKKGGFSQPNIQPTNKPSFINASADALKLIIHRAHYM
jgi:hypothetical protein